MDGTEPIKCAGIEVPMEERTPLVDRLLRAIEELQAESFLKDIGEYDNTVIIFCSDNGPNPWFSEDYPGNRGSAWIAQFDNSFENVGHPG